MPPPIWADEEAVRSHVPLPALLDLEERLTERTQESERLRAEIGHLGEIAAENTFLQGLASLTGFLREARVQEMV
jgi:hypothetical protein